MVPTYGVVVTQVDTSMAYVQHLIPFVLLFVDFAVNNIPYLLAQSSLYSVFYSAFYVGVSLVAWRERWVSSFCSDPGCIYQGYDWSDPVQASVISLVVVFVVSPLLSGLTWCVSDSIRVALGLHGGMPWISLKDGRAVSKADFCARHKPWYCACAHVELDEDAAAVEVRA